MADESVQELRQAAGMAHRGGDIEAAVLIYQLILEKHPHSREATEAAFYLTSIGRGRAQVTKRSSMSGATPRAPRTLPSTSVSE